MLELHIHGGPATVKAVMSTIHQIDPLLIRTAAPGEFTRRAFANGRLDLGQVESLGNTLSAETELQRRAALRGRSGQLGRIYEQWRSELIEGLALASADTDHSEEHSLDDMAGIWSDIVKLAEHIRHEIKYHRKGARRGETLRKGIQVSLIGLPNAGKSSLFNHIVGREASIVNQQAGTTRDIVEALVDYDGYFCTFADTAGVRVADIEGDSEIGSIEQEGIKRAIAKAKDADVIIYVTSFEPDPHNSSAHEIPIMEDLTSAVQGQDGKFKPMLIVINKSDRVPPEEGIPAVESFKQDIVKLFGPKIRTPICAMSVLRAESGEKDMDNFRDSLVLQFRALTNMPVIMEHLIGVTERQSQLLKPCSEHLKEFLEVASDPPFDSSIAIHHLELALKCLDEMTGRFEGAGNVEEILSRVFSK